MKTSLWVVVLLSLTIFSGCSNNKPVGDIQKEIAVEDTQPTKLMSWPDLTDRPMPKPTHEIRIGEGATDIVDLWLPDGAGPHPVVLMVHGGCWQKAIADRTLMNYAAEDLRARGLAVWNIEYRGVDETGGGYPGTFQDVAKAADALQDHAAAHNLDLSLTAGFGHSAGGHLVLWLAGRKSLPKTSLLFLDNPLTISTVINSGGLADLEESAPVTSPSCLKNIMPKLTGKPSDDRPDVFMDTSASELLPMNVNQISVNGDQDGIAPVILGQKYTLKAQNAGDEAEFITAPNSGHVELISPGTTAFNIQAERLEKALLK